MKIKSLGCCARCGSKHIAITSDNKKVVCLDCYDWEWIEDAIYSCWFILS